VDFDKFLLARIREFKVICQHLDNSAVKVEVMVDPERAADDIIVRLGQVSKAAIRNL
jgi:predicted neutral ceramidase superfamily lipid hydrolase